MLVLAIGALAIGPAVGRAVRGKRWQVALNALTLVLVAGTCLVVLLPHAYEHGGPIAVLVAALAAAGPAAIDRFGGRRGRLWKGIAIAVIAIHAALDGAALAVLGAGDDVHAALGAAVVVHRLPVGLLIDAAARRDLGERFGPHVGWAAVGLLALATVVGFALGPPLSAIAGEAGEGLIEGLVVGALLHIVFDGLHERSDDRPAVTAGAVVGGALLLGVIALT